MTKDRVRNTCAFAPAALLAALLAGGALAVPPSANMQAQPRRGGKSSATRAPAASAAQLYSQAFFAYENFDTSDKAPQNFNRVIKEYPRSPEAASAQFFLGSFYQRKYQLKARDTGTGDADTLDEARKAYLGYITKYPQDSSCQCLSDAYFNLGLVYFQLGHPAKARVELEKINEFYAFDRQVYIYQVVSSPNQKDIVNSHFDAVRLAKYTSSILSQRFDTAASLLRKWCMSEKSRS